MTTTREMMNQAANNQAPQVPADEKTACNAMRAAFILAHTENNKKAIDAKMCQNCGIPVSKLEQWKDWTNKLRSVISDYVVAKSVKNHDAKEVEKLRNKIFPAWRKVLKAGEEDTFHPQMFVSEFDVDTLVGLAETWIGTAHGTAWTVQTSTMFRKGLEAYIGCRMAGNAVLTDEDRDTIRDYENAQKLIVRKNEELYGKKDNQGNHIDGVIDTLTKVTGKIVALDKQVAHTTVLLKSAEGEILEYLQNVIESAKVTKDELSKDQSTLENQKNQALDKIKEAEATIKELAEKYQVSIAKIKEIEE